MYCSELNRLLDLHSELTMEFFRQDGRTQEFYFNVDDWTAACKRLEELEQQLAQVAGEIASHRREHGCESTAEAVLTTEGTENAEKHELGTTW